ncbi:MULTISPECIES: hypothetical protein [unclassified Kitasatospora]|uniref:hypothetical protein n=1 Tax=unclassified Kitasatospora TaxID=2633591 RepID=UPI00070A6B40|nr:MULTISPECIES: hypothetical protein [unclassified Kitasatospora]KQV20854.1 hypothetical protein ASC99_20310 [Kitasatospora sp. Root107]KRB60491.1 hypothetical protein ASE03_12870 [Kitasatospora sp. Root187]
MSFQLDDATRQLLESAHTRAAAFLGLACSGPPVFGTSGSTAGRRAGNLWLRVSSSRRRHAPRASGQGPLGAEQCIPESVPRPRLHDTLDWTEGDRFYQADVFDLVGPAVSASPDLRKDPGLEDSWWSGLKTALTDIATAPGTKITLRPAWIEEVFPKYLGIPAPTHVERVTGHGDLQWANLTARRLMILDWERWGLVPLGYDPAVLWVSSFLVPTVADRIRAEFSDVLDTPAGRVGQLVALAEMLQAVDRGYYPELAPLLADAAYRLTGVRPAH